jgi:endo-1,4-beta-xylanase
MVLRDKFMILTCFRSRHLPSAALFLLVAVLQPGFAGSSASAEDDPFAQANVRIDQHRKAGATITVVDAAGRPVPGVHVDIRQTRHEFLFGCMCGHFCDRDPDASCRQRFVDVFNYATLPFYWPWYERHRGKPDHSFYREVAEWLRKEGVVVKGHTLAWNIADPGWLPDDLDEVHTLQLARIDDCVSQFKGLIDRWDVVNEATFFERGQLKNAAPKLTAMWLQVGRVEFIQECFARARAANPNDTLLINDYRTDPPYASLIEKMVDAGGRPIYDIIGIQSHMFTAPWPNRKIWDVCERFARFGRPLHFTEATIASGKRLIPWISTPDGETRQATEAERFYTMLFSHPAIQAITWWSLSDHNGVEKAPTGLLRKDFSPKPAYETLRKLIKETWWTTASLTSDDAGQAKFRGFLGQYTASATPPGKPAVQVPFTLKKDQANVLRIVVQ